MVSHEIENLQEHTTNNRDSLVCLLNKADTTLKYNFETLIKAILPNLQTKGLEKPMSITSWLNCKWTTQLIGYFENFVLVDFQFGLYWIVNRTIL